MIVALALITSGVISPPNPKEVSDILNEAIRTEQTLSAISWCESRDRDYDEHGNVLQGPTGDFGRFQIVARLHQKKAESLGYDIFTPEGNEAYARYLYRMEGLAPWSASRKCIERELVKNEFVGR